jgi:hypothetical protein
MTERAAPSRSEREALELLPWYVNGTLAGEERERVRRALRSSLTCRLEFERLCRMRELMLEDDAEHAAADRGYERLMARIEASRSSPRAAAAAAAAARPAPARWMGLAQAAAVIALVGGAAWWWSQGPAADQGSFETLTADNPAASAAPHLRLVFANGVPEEARREILEDLGLTLAAPPTAGGIYTIALPENVDPRPIAEKLRADPRIILVTTPPAGEAP